MTYRLLHEGCDCNTCCGCGLLENTKFAGKFMCEDYKEARNPEDSIKLFK